MCSMASISIVSLNVVIAPATAERFSSINVFQPRNVLLTAWLAKRSGVFEIRRLNRSGIFIVAHTYILYST